MGTVHILSAEAGISRSIFHGLEDEIAGESRISYSIFIAGVLEILLALVGSIFSCLRHFRWAVCLRSRQTFILHGSSISLENDRMALSRLDVERTAAITRKS